MEDDYDSDSSSTDRTPYVFQKTDERIEAPADEDRNELTEKDAPSPIASAGPEFTPELIEISGAEDEGKTEGDKEAGSQTLLVPAEGNMTWDPIENPAVEDEGKGEAGKDNAPPSATESPTEGKPPTTALAQTDTALEPIKNQVAENEDNTEGGRKDDALPTPATSELIEDAAAKDTPPSASETKSRTAAPICRSPDEGSEMASEQDFSSPNNSQLVSSWLGLNHNTSIQQATPDPRWLPRRSVSAGSDAPSDSIHDAASDAPPAENPKKHIIRRIEVLQCLTSPPRTILAWTFYLSLFLLANWPILSSLTPARTNTQTPTPLRQRPDIPLPISTEAEMNWNPPCISGTTLIGSYPCKLDSSVVEKMELSIREARHQVYSSCLEVVHEDLETAFSNAMNDAKLGHLVSGDACRVLVSQLHRLMEMSSDASCHKGIGMALGWIQRAEAYELDIIIPLP